MLDKTRPNRISNTSRMALKAKFGQEAEIALDQIVASHPNIKSFRYHEVHAPHTRTTGEGEEYTLVYKGRIGGAEIVAQHNLGSAGVSMVIGAQVTFPESALVFIVSYYGKYWLDVTYVLPALKHLPELVQTDQSSSITVQAPIAVCPDVTVRVVNLREPSRMKIEIIENPFPPTFHLSTDHKFQVRVMAYYSDQDMYMGHAMGKTVKQAQGLAVNRLNEQLTRNNLRQLEGFIPTTEVNFEQRQWFSWKIASATPFTESPESIEQGIRRAEAQA